VAVVRANKRAGGGFKGQATRSPAPPELNGHEYAKRQLDREKIAYQPLDNGIRSCANPKRLQAICDSLSADRIDTLPRKWFRRLPHPFPA
jgi:hypothetical protein